VGQHLKTIKPLITLCFKGFLFLVVTTMLQLLNWQKAVFFYLLTLFFSECFFDLLCAFLFC
jgi:hypothetical protein